MIIDLLCIGEFKEKERVILMRNYLKFDKIACFLMFTEYR